MCHDGPCPSCSLLPENCHTCACGKTRIDNKQRTSCLDPVRSQLNLKSRCKNSISDFECILVAHMWKIMWQGTDMWSNWQPSSMSCFVSYWSVSILWKRIDTSMSLWSVDKVDFMHRSCPVWSIQKSILLWSSMQQEETVWKASVSLQDVISEFEWKQETICVDLDVMNYVVIVISISARWYVGKC